MTGYRTFIEIRNELKFLDVKVFLAHPSDPVYDSLQRAKRIGEPLPFEVFSTIHDAVLYAQQSKIDC